MSPARPPRFVEILPGLALAVMVALSARLAHRLLPHEAASVLGEVIFAVVIGLALGNLLPVPAQLQPGIRFSFHSVLRAAIILLGASFSFHQVLAIGGKAVLMIAALMAVALTTAHLLGRAAGIPGRLATLIGVGTAVCGNSAIVATAPVIQARDEDVSFAVATNTLFGTLAVLTYPLLGRALGFDDATFGTWAGTAVNDTSQVVAAGFAFSEPAGRVATAVKLTRNALMGFVIVGVGMAYARGAVAEAAVAGIAGGSSTFWKRLQQSVPLFVVGFLLMALLNTLGVFRQLSPYVGGGDLAKMLQDTARVLILVALAGVGLSTRIEAMRRTGAKPFWIGFAAAIVTSATSLLLIRLFGPASL